MLHFSLNWMLQCCKTLVTDRRITDHRILRRKTDSELNKENSFTLTYTRREIKPTTKHTKAHEKDCLALTRGVEHRMKTKKTLLHSLTLGER